MDGLEQVRQRFLGKVVLVPSSSPIGPSQVRGQVSEISLDSLTGRSVVYVLVTYPGSWVETFFLEDALRCVLVVGDL